MLQGKILSKTQGPATAEDREEMNKIPYASAIGSIMYAMLCTRPDVAHAISLTSTVALANVRESVFIVSKLLHTYNFLMNLCLPRA
jgi:hypothetical protein